MGHSPTDQRPSHTYLTSLSAFIMPPKKQSTPKATDADGAPKEKKLNGLTKPMTCRPSWPPLWAPRRENSWPDLRSSRGSGPTSRNITTGSREQAVLHPGQDHGAGVREREDPRLLHEQVPEGSHQRLVLPGDDEAEVIVLTMFITVKLVYLYAFKRSLLDLYSPTLQHYIFY